MSRKAPRESPRVPHLCFPSKASSIPRRCHRRLTGLDLQGNVAREVAADVASLTGKAEQHRLGKIYSEDDQG